MPFPGDFKGARLFHLLAHQLRLPFILVRSNCEAVQVTGVDPFITGITNIR